MNYFKRASRIAARLCIAIALASSPIAMADDHEMSLDEIYQVAVQGEYNKALRLIDQKISTSANKVRPIFVKGVILSEAGEYDAAIALFENVARDYPTLAEPYNNLAMLYLQQGRFEDAEEALKFSTKINPAYSVAHENLGDLYIKLASSSYNRAFYLDKNNKYANSKLSLIDKLFGMPSSATESGGLPDPYKAARQQTKNETTNTVLASASEKAQKGSSRPLAVHLLYSWSAAWSAKEVDRYISFYSNDFVPSDNKTFEEWKQNRIKRLSFPKFIEVNVSNISSKLKTDGSLEVGFTQVYSSNQTHDVSNKKLTFKQYGDNWKIVREETINSEQHFQKALNLMAEQLVYAWSEAWSEQHFNKYMAYYSKKFKPENGQSYNAWRTKRRERLTAPAFIQVQVADLTAHFETAGLLVIRFTQQYTTNVLKDVSIKELTYIKQNNRWRIYRERTVQ